MAPFSTRPNGLLLPPAALSLSALDLSISESYVRLHLLLQVSGQQMPSRRAGRPRSFLRSWSGGAGARNVTLSIARGGTRRCQDNTRWHEGEGEGEREGEASTSTSKTPRVRGAARSRSAVKASCVRDAADGRALQDTCRRRRGHDARKVSVVLAASPLKNVFLINVAVDFLRCIRGRGGARLGDEDAVGCCSA